MHANWRCVICKAWSTLPTHRDASWFNKDDIRSLARITRSQPRHKKKLVIAFENFSLSSSGFHPDDPGERRGRCRKDACTAVMLVRVKQRNFHGHGPDLVIRYRARKIRVEKENETNRCEKQPWEQNRRIKRKQVIELKRYRMAARQFLSRGESSAGDIVGSNGIISATHGPKAARIVSRNDH